MSAESLPGGKSSQILERRGARMNQGSFRSKCTRYFFRSTSAVWPFIFLSMFVRPVHAQYTRTDLVSNQAGAVPTQDAHLVNGWGLVSLKGSPYWVSDNLTGFSTLYAAAGTQVPLFVSIPAAPGSPAGTLGTPTGVVGNISPNPTDFSITEGSKSGAAVFVFATLDGTISAWNPVVDGIGNSHATIPPGGFIAGASYTGLAI